MTKSRVFRGCWALVLIFGWTALLPAQVVTVELPGTIQSALGGSNWNTNVETTRMEDQGNGVWEFVAALPKGEFEYKVAVNGSWDINYGKDGVDHGDNIKLAVPVKDTIVKFVFTEVDHMIVDSINNPGKVKAPAAVPPKRVLVAPILPGKAFLDSANRVRVQLDAPSTESDLAKVARVTVGGQSLAVTAVKGLSFGAAGGTDPSQVVLAGTLQKALGGSEWNPGDAITRMWEISPGVYEFVAKLPQGAYEFKAAQGGSWEKNWGKDGTAGGDNATITVKQDAIVRFVFDPKTPSLKDSVNNPEILAPVTVPLTPAFLPPKDGPTSVFDLTLARDLVLDDFSKPMGLTVGEKEYTVYAREALNAPAYFHAADDLGARWSAASTTFKVWSPVSDSVKLELFWTPGGTDAEVVPMVRDATGTWSATVKGDLDGRYYQYRYHSYGKDRVAADISGYSASQDGKRSQVVNLAQTNPANWAADKSPPLPKTTDAILYEMHTRDFTIDPSSGVDPALRGTYLGLVQRGTKVNGKKGVTGLDYLVKLGVTDIHLLPIQKFNPGNTAAYNWGYETTLFNVPDARYSTTPNDGLKTINEVKTMVAGLHSAGLRLVLDVVYNHTVPALGDSSAFDASVPYYYFRTDDTGRVLNESGVGNAVHDERPMVRKYIKDSLLYWINEYRVDGFRFDLVGMFVPETVKVLTEAVHAVRPDAVMYGEPWTGGGPTRFPKGAQQGMVFAVFNDNYRNVLRGDLDGVRKGYSTGGSASPADIQRGLAGSFDYGGNLKDFATSPRETINYISAHDNAALVDKIALAFPDPKDKLRLNALKLSGAMILAAQGIPFLEGGAEMGRTKGGNKNSYNAGDAVNRFDWVLGQKYTAVTDYYAGLIALRRAHPAFRMDDPEQVRQVLKFIPPRSNASPVVSYTLDGTKVGDSWKTILFVSNSKTSESVYTLPAGTWTVVVNGTKAGTKKLGTATGTLKLDAMSAYVLYQN